MVESAPYSVDSIKQFYGSRYSSPTIGSEVVIVFHLLWTPKRRWYFSPTPTRSRCRSQTYSPKRIHLNLFTDSLGAFCFLNLWLSKALNWSQKSIVKFRHFLCLYMIYIERKVVCRKCMCVCVCVCVCVCLSFYKHLR